MEISVEKHAIVEGMKTYLIHGERHVTVFYAHRDDPDTIHRASLNADALPEGLRVGDSVVVHTVMGVVAEIRRATDG